MPDPTPADPLRPSQPADERSPGWHVDPAPDGRGAPSEQKPPLLPRFRRWLPFFLALLAVNLVLSFLTAAPVQRTQVPYQPFFVGQVRAGNVEEISSRGDSLEGVLKRPAR